MGWVGDDETADEIALQYLKKIKARINYERAIAHENGLACWVQLSEANDDYVEGACFVHSTDPVEVREAKALRKLTFHYFESFCELSPDHFERLCGRVLELLRVERPIVTRSSADQGIDFFGELSIGNLIKPKVLTPGAERQLRTWMVGQAKHYTAIQVSTADIRELVGSVSLAKAKVFAGKSDPLNELSIRVCDPVFFLFFTTGSMSRDARQLLHKSGVVGMDGMQLAMFLADHGIAQVNGEFMLEAFLGWVS